MTFFRSDGTISDVSETKMGRIPKALNATKSGINGRKILREINWVKKWSRQSIKIEYKKRVALGKEILPAFFNHGILYGDRTLDYIEIFQASLGGTMPFLLYENFFSLSR
jgi:hypothetical protein